MEENHQEQFSEALASEDKKKEDGNKKPVNSFLLFELGIEFAVIIALPLIGGIYLGQWLDMRYNQKFFVIIGILLALGLSSYMIYRKIKDVIKLLK